MSVAIVLLQLLLLLLILAADGCQPNAKGGTCFSGLLFDDQQPQQLAQFESCKEDLKRDWCTIVYKEDTGEAEFHCYNHYNINPFLGLPQCGDETHFDVNSGGCKRMRRADGGNCLLCCCRGGNCNNPTMFRIEQQRFQSGRIGWKLGSSRFSRLGMLLLVAIMVFIVQ